MMKRRFFVGLLLGITVGCNPRNQNAGSGLLTSGTDLKTPLKFAVSDVQGLAALQRDYEPFRAALAASLGRTVEFYPVDGYTAVAAPLQSGELDIALIGPSEYVLLRARTNAIPAIGISRPGYYSAIAIRSDSSIQSVADLKGKTIAMYQVGSTSGHLGPTHILVEAGLNPKTDYQVQMLGREGSFAALRNGEVDAWAGPAGDYQKYLQNAQSSGVTFPLLEKGPPLPSDTLIVSSRMKPETIAQLRDRILVNGESLVAALGSTPENFKYQQSTLVPVEDSNYDSIREVYRAIGEGNFL
ncbi:phosphate/phosphite/phosphonate ABC transporter substrate-binding protein [Roseofilum casamattae]|nr:phosphate/phosphite/phosphonate ABC transporter substrate-binding protein [Roseofilum casamattae]